MSAEEKPKGEFATATFFEPLEPFCRGDRYEDPLDEWFEANPGIGTVDGGGSALDKEMGIASVDVAIVVYDETKVPLIIAKLEELGAPMGSEFHFKGQVTKFGKNQGIAIHFPLEEVNKSCEGERNMNFVLEHLNKALEGAGSVTSWRQNKNGTTLYGYGPSAAAMQEHIAEFMGSNELCKTADVVDMELHN